MTLAAIHGGGRYDYGLWSFVVVNAVLVLFFLASFLRPARQREWRSFGVVTAFFAALFAEMYGFPLTIYLLTTLLGRSPFADPFSHDSGNLTVSLLGLGTVWGWFFMALGGALLIAGLMVVAKGWCRIHAAGGELVTDGPYARVRHPQYSGLMLTIGGALIQWPTLPTLVMAPVLVATYYRLALREEHALGERFGARYTSYAQRTPRFIPRRRPATEGPPRKAADASHMA